MLPYFLILLLIVLFQARYKLGEKIILFSDKKKFYFLAILLFLFAAFRGNGKGDYFTYKEYCESVTSWGIVMDNNFPAEIGFRFISYIINYLGMDSQWIIIIMNFISITCMIMVINKYSENKALSLLVFFPIFLSFDMHASRTAVAISISFLSMKYIIERKFLRYIFFIMLASTFHRSVIIAILLYPIALMNINTVLAILIMFLSIIISRFIDINQLIVEILDFVNLDGLSRKYYSYTQSAEYGYAFKLYDPRLTLNIIIYFVSKLVCNLKEKKYIICINAILLSNILTILLSNNIIFVIRFTSYFNVYSVLLITYILNNINIKQKKIVKGTLIFVYILYSGILISKQVDYKLFFI